MANLEHARCPNCNKTANGIKKVDDLFGFRTLDKKYQYVQSWCRVCRKKQIQERYLNQK